MLVNVNSQNILESSLWMVAIEPGITGDYNWNFLKFDEDTVHYLNASFDINYSQKYSVSPEEDYFIIKNDHWGYIKSEKKELQYIVNDPILENEPVLSLVLNLLTPTNIECDTQSLLKIINHSDWQVHLDNQSVNWKVRAIDSIDFEHPLNSPNSCYIKHYGTYYFLVWISKDGFTHMLPIDKIGDRKMELSGIANIEAPILADRID